MKPRYGLTVGACSVAYVVQSIVNNFLPLLFVHFTFAYKIPLYLISTIIVYNFVLQILIDFLASSLILKIGHRASCILSGICVVTGLLFLAIVTPLLSGYIFIYINIMVAVSFMAMGSGLIEVLLSPILEALPFDNKSAKMSFLHSFYPLGHLLVILISTLYFTIFGIEHWTYLALVILTIPLLQIFLFAICPIVVPKGDENKVKKFSLFKNKRFILIFILMVAAGASEMSIAQWASYFAESGLKVSKTVGDLVGASAFALFMFLSRILHGFSGKRFNVANLIVICAGALVVCYLLTVLQPSEVLSLVFIALCGFFVGIAWPGVYSIGGKLFASGGTVMFSMMALGGDIGCSLGPMIVGFVASGSSMDLGIMLATIFPLVLFIGMLTLKKTAKAELIEVK